MLYVIEGIRCSGKSFLINELIKSGKDIFRYKFDYMNQAREIFSKTNFGSFSIGKDLQLLNLFSKEMFDKNIVLDRGIISSLVYGKTFKRLSNQQFEDIIDILEYNGLIDNVNFIYIDPDIEKLKEIIIHREKNDIKEFSSMNIKTQLNGYNSFIEKYGTFMDIKSIKNNFDDDSVSKFINAFKEI